MALRLISRSGISLRWLPKKQAKQPTCRSHPANYLASADERHSSGAASKTRLGILYEWVDGVLINDNKGYICNKPSLFASTLTADYKPLSYINANANGYPFEIGYDENYPEAQFPIAVGAGSSTGYADYYYQNTGLRGAFFGGYATMARARACSSGTCSMLLRLRFGTWVVAFSLSHRRFKRGSGGILPQGIKCFYKEI